jgi:hypothetical protein
VRTAWRTLDDGEFFCAGCGGDRSYRLRAGRLRFAVLGVPLLPRGDVAPVVECAACRRHHDPRTLDRPTTHRLAGMVRDAVHAVALAMLAAGGSDPRATRDAAVAAVRAAGYPECTEERLLALLGALPTDPLREALAPGPAELTELHDPGELHGPGEPREPHEPDGPDGPAGGVAHHRMAAHIELCEALEPLTPHLEPAGRETLLLQGAAIALADGPYEPAERDMLQSVGYALALCPDETERLLAAARAPF